MNKLLKLIGGLLLCGTWHPLGHLPTCHGTELKEITIQCDEQADWLERLAAQEIRRYVYVRTGTLLKIETHTADGAITPGIIVGTAGRSICAAFLSEGKIAEQLQQLQAGQYLLQSLPHDAATSVLVVGGDGVGTLYAAYRFAEHLGVRFYLHGDVVPDERVIFQLPTVDEMGKPLFATRGIQPFHDFPEGPDWWNTNDYKAILAQLPKLRMNFFGLHTYPEGGVGPEPTVWIGTPAELGKAGRVKASYPARHFVTGNVTGAWGYQPKDTSDYAFGADQMFSRDNYGADYMLGTHPWTEMDQQQANDLFERYADVLKESFTFARSLGIKTCVGTETPLVIPRLVQARLRESDEDVDDAAARELLYEGIFRRIMAAYPLDYYWLWTPENWTWKEVQQQQIDATLADLSAVEKAARKCEVPFQLATCGWVLGPPQTPALFDSVLPKSWPLSCINRNVGHDPVEPGFAHVSGRPQWAIPWLEDDPAMILPQLWVGRMRKDAADALRYGCDGLLGIHWRTRILGPNVAALAQAAWSQESWKTAAVDTDPPHLEGTFDNRRADYARWRSADCQDFYADWAAAEFGARAARGIAPLFANLDCRLPRPSTWVDGPGGIVPDPRPWSMVSQEYRFVDALSKLRPLITGEGNRERFDYWLSNFRYLRAVGKLNCTWAELNEVLELMHKTESPSTRKRIAVQQALPLRGRLVRELTNVQRYLLETVTTKGAMGNVANWQQHVFPMLLDASEKAITDATGKPLPPSAQLPREYPGEPRLFVPVVRTSLNTGEPLQLELIVLGARPVVTRFFWRSLGDPTFHSLPLRHVARGVYDLQLKNSQFEGDLEYYIEVTLDSQQLRFPATAPALNQTVVVIDHAE